MCKAHGGWCGCAVSIVTKVLLIVGGLNWGLVGVAMLMDKAESWNVVSMLLGSMPTVEAVVYVLVGVAALVSIFGCKCRKCTGGVCKDCAPGDKMEGQM